MDREEIKKHVEPIIARCSVLDRPDVRRKFQMLWGSAECRDYMMKLLVADRLGREGLPPEDFSAIDLLLSIHDHVYPMFNRREPEVVFHR